MENYAFIHYGGKTDSSEYVEDSKGNKVKSHVKQLSESQKESLMKLLNEYGPHYKNHFGPDMRLRLNPMRTDEKESIIGVVAIHKPTSRVVSHCCVIYNGIQPSSPQIGLFGAVITTKEHQRKGLSKTCVRKTLERWDRIHKDKSILILGTGSPHAAKVYAKHGFKHLNGGLDSGKKGYNPDDMGEWIMIRGEFDASTYYCDSSTELELEPLRRTHWAALVLLMNAMSTKSDKLPSLGITDGTEAEEAIVALMNRVCHHKYKVNDYDRFTRVCLDKSNRVLGICVNRDDFYAANKQAESKLLENLRESSRGLRLFVTGMTVSLMVGLRYFYGSK
eukprot:g1822.t1